MRLGKVYLSMEYVVDLDNEHMVMYAKDSLYDDIYQSVVKSDDLFQFIDTEEVSGLKESDIPEFLKESEEDEG